MSRGASVAEVTSVAAADLVHDFVSMLLVKEVPKPRSTWTPPKDEL